MLLPFLFVSARILRILFVSLQKGTISFTNNQTKEIIIMCQTALISNQIVRLGTRSYKQRLEAKSKGYSISQLARLNKIWMDCMNCFIVNGIW